MWSKKFLKSVDITKESRENTLNMRKSTGDYFIAES